MTTTASVILAWETLFQTASLQAITENYYTYEILENTETDISKYMFNQEINFFIIDINKKTNLKLFGSKTEQFQVEVKYYKEHSTDGTGTNQKAIKTALETVYSGVEADLGRTWSSTVDYYELQDSIFPLQSLELAGRDVWLGKIVFNGIKTIC